jgi:hypothetical protein
MLSLRGSIQSSLKLSRQTHPRPNERKEGTWNGYPRPRGPCQLPTRLAPHRRPASGVRPLSRSPSLPNFPPVLPASFCASTHGLVLVAPGRAGGPSPLRDGIAKLGDCLVHNSANARKARVAVLRDAAEVLWSSIYGSLPIAHVPSVSGTPTPAFAPPGAGVDPNPGSAKVM